MGFRDLFLRKKQKADNAEYPYNEHEYCTYCFAALPLQKGYSNDLPYWVCKGCGGMLINPDVPDDSDIAWLCDECEAMLNIQPGFTDTCGVWQCTECGYENNIVKSEVYATDDEYKAARSSPYRGMTEEDILSIMDYEEVDIINERDDILLVTNMTDDNYFVKKILKIYDTSVYRYLQKNPVPGMPRLYGVFEGSNALVIIEEYIEGRTLEHIIADGPVRAGRAVELIRQLAVILKELHNQEIPIIHRDVKPSNIIITEGWKVYLIDINVAKWYKTEEKEDTRFLGTQYYAAPEQVGYGFLASTPQTDIYAVGVILNELLTGKRPKEEKATGALWDIISKCLSMESKDRYTDEELLEALDNISGELNEE